MMCKRHERGHSQEPHRPVHEGMPWSVCQLQLGGFIANPHMRCMLCLVMNVDTAKSRIALSMKVRT